MSSVRLATRHVTSRHVCVYNDATRLSVIHSLQVNYYGSFERAHTAGDFGTNSCLLIYCIPNVALVVIAVE